MVFPLKVSLCERHEHTHITRKLHHQNEKNNEIRKWDKNQTIYHTWFWISLNLNVFAVFCFFSFYNKRIRSWPAWLHISFIACDLISHAHMDNTTQQPNKFTLTQTLTHTHTLTPTHTYSMREIFCSGESETHILQQRHIHTNSKYAWADTKAFLVILHDWF